MATIILVENYDASECCIHTSGWTFRYAEAAPSSLTPLGILYFTPNVRKRDIFADCHITICKQASASFVCYGAGGAAFCCLNMHSSGTWMVQDVQVDDDTNPNLLA